jgi:hypothetical protein
VDEESSERHRKNNALNRERLKRTARELRRQKFVERFGPLLDERDERNRFERSIKEEE